MVVISEDLVRKHSEHNDCEISTLEELSLHQCDVEKIENIDRWCRHLKILYLQGNLIPKIENLSHLKQLEYLNLALNNIKRFEGLHGCESLKKLDLTANFIAELTSISALKSNAFLEILFLTGNPCTEYSGYREFIIATLPQLRQLDGYDVEKSERILSLQNYENLKSEIIRQEKLALQYHILRAPEKISLGKPLNKSEADADHFWEEVSDYSPESRVQVHKHLENLRSSSNATGDFGDTVDPKPGIRYFNNDGKPLNLNQAKVDFSFNDDEESGEYRLEVCCYKHLDTSLINVDVQPTYVRVLIKGKALQIVFPSEVSPDQSLAQRSSTTGHLVLSMPKASGLIRAKVGTVKGNCHLPSKGSKTLTGNMRETLEVNEKLSCIPDISQIVPECKRSSTVRKASRLPQGSRMDKIVVGDFIDNPDVPPLL